MSGISEIRLKVILDEKFGAQREYLDEKFKPYEEARLQTWDNRDDILIMKTEKKTIKWGLVAIYTLVGSCIQIVGFLIALEIFKK
jgi:hypothetical protein